MAADNKLWSVEAVAPSIYMYTLLGPAGTRKRNDGRIPPAEPSGPWVIGSPCPDTGNSNRYDSDWGTIGKKLGRNYASIYLYYLSERCGLGRVFSPSVAPRRCWFLCVRLPARYQTLHSPLFSIRNLRLSKIFPPLGPPRGLSKKRINGAKATTPPLKIEVSTEH